MNLATAATKKKKKIQQCWCYKKPHSKKFVYSVLFVNFLFTFAFLTQLTPPALSCYSQFRISRLSQLYHVVRFSLLVPPRPIHTALEKSTQIAKQVHLHFKGFVLYAFFVNQSLRYDKKKSYIYQHALLTERLKQKYINLLGEKPVGSYRLSSLQVFHTMICVVI